jgi:hypothetical protein
MPDPRVGERLDRVAALLSCAFWALSLGIIVLFLWLVVVGGLQPGDAAPFSGGVAVHGVIWALRARLLSRRGIELTRHPDVVREFERRGFY